MGVPVVVAIFVGLACSFIQSLGLTIQRKSHVQDEAKPLEERQRAVRRPLWIIGFAIYISSNIFGSVFQIGALPIVVLAPLGGVSLLWNSVLAHVLLGESFTSAMLLGTVFIATGAVLIAIFGVVPDGNHSLDELLSLWVRPAFIVFFVAICLAIVLVLAAAHMTVWRIQSRGIRLPDEDSPSNYASPRNEAAIPFRPTALGLASPRSSISSIQDIRGVDKVVRFADNLETREDRTLTFCGLAFAAVSGTLSGLCLVLAKSAVELVITTIDHWRTGRGQNEFTRIQTWFLVAGLGLAAVLQLVYLNYSLAFASPALICPLAFCFYNLASIFDGLVYYDQLGRLSVHQVLLVSIGVAVLLVGVWTVSAIQPTGDGGVEVGTWAEEEWAHEQTWFEEAVVDEPDDDEAHDELEAATGAVLATDATTPPLHEHDHPVSAPSVHSPPPPPRLPRIDAVGAAAANIGTGPYTGAVPQSPISPTRAQRPRRPRYGTLIPDLAPAGGMPTGFAFGIGAASPGFALRSNSISHRSPSLSNSGHTHSASRSSSNLAGLPISSPTQQGRRARAQSEAAARPNRMRMRMSLPGAVPSESGEEQVAATLAAWDENEAPRRRGLARLFSGGSGVKLP